MPKKFEGISPQEGGEGEEQEIIMTPYTWRRGDRPRGYQETTSIIRIALGAGLDSNDLLKDLLPRWETLIDKALKDGLTQTEANEMVTFSKEINERLTKALDEAAREKK